MTQKTPLAIQKMQENAVSKLATAHSLINRSYLSDLKDYAVHDADKNSLFTRASDMRVFRIERLVHHNKQSIIESTTAAYTALGAAGYTVFLYLSSNGVETDIYIGTRGEPGRMLGQNSGALLQETFKGHFAGSSLQALAVQESGALLDKLEEEKNNPSASITAVTGVPALSTENREHFMQGLERFIDAAEQRSYQALILAEPMSAKSLDQVRLGYEQVATQLSPLLKQQLSFGQQDSESVGISISQGLSDSLGTSLGLTETKGVTETRGTSSTETRGTFSSISSQTASSKTASVVGGMLGSAVATMLNKQQTDGSSYSSTTGTNTSYASSSSAARSETETSTQTTSTTDSRSVNQTLGSSRQLSIEAIDKTVEQLLTKIDHHLERIDEAKTYGGWNSAAYFIGDSTASSESLASIFLGLIRGSKSSHEDFALTTWTSKQKSSVIDWLSKLTHPQLRPSFSKYVPVSYVSPATLISGKEMAIQMSLPRRSTSTVSVVETQSFGRKVQYLDGTVTDGVEGRSLELGHIRHLWENLPQTINLNLEQLTGHVFVSGSTGSGKSNTLYEILDQLSAKKVNFLVIEPAKGEYKHVFGHRSDVSVFGTNPAHSALLKINPFCFPEAIHVLEHVDRLVEIFNVCWPMYAAMPAVLKEAILQAYEKSGWDLELSTNRYSNTLFPTFIDLLQALQLVIQSSAYSDELKANYIGSLSTRVKSLTNGLNGQIFGADEIDNNLLFDSNVIVDLSRVGSSETKALIMGVLVMRLSEYRMAGGEMDQPLKHVTVIEEAHNILKRNSADGGSEGANLVGKSVEMLTNAIAEMRTYGEGFIIVDQSPHAVDIAAIRNTNTKIIMRLPDEMDRRLVGKSVGLRDEQLEEIAKLPKGVAIVYQNDWLEPVLCQVNRFGGEISRYKYQAKKNDRLTSRYTFNSELLNFLLVKRIHKPAAIDVDLLRKGVSQLPLGVQVKVSLLKALDEYENDEPVQLWQETSFDQLSNIVVSVLNCRDEVAQHIQTVADYEELTLRLNTLLQERVETLSSELVLAAEQCLMKDFSESNKGEQALDVYSAWHAYRNKGGVQ